MRRDGGFVLLETLVATAIVAMLLAALFNAATTEARAARRVADTRAALMVARSQLDAVGSAIPLRPGLTRGLDGPLAWTVAVERYGRGTAAGAPMRVEARVAARGRTLARLATIKLAPVR